MSTNAQNDSEILKKWVLTAVVTEESISEFGIDNCFQSTPITDSIFNRIWQKSYKSNCTIPRSSLRYLRILHRNKNGKPQLGELICNASIAKDVLDIFRTLYDKGYRIERMVLIDEYGANDEASMSANNTSCFNFRHVAGSTTLSKHSQGLAIDINPVVNPCIDLRSNKIEPSNSKSYAYNRINKNNTSLQMIDRNDLCYKLFILHGFRWGGAWKTKKDYQHFEK